MGWCPQLAIGDNADRLLRRGWNGPRGEERIVGQDRSNADQDSVMLRAHLMHSCPALTARYPLALAIRERDPSVHAGRNFQRDMRARHRSVLVKFGGFDEFSEVRWRVKIAIDAGIANIPNRIDDAQAFHSEFANIL